MQIYGQFDGYHILKHLGSRFHGEVVIAQKENKKYAVKLFKGKDGGFQNWKHEIEILKQLDHPNIAKLIQFKENVQYKTSDLELVKRSAIVLQHIQGGQLMYYLLVGRFSEAAARTYFKIILNTLGFIHSKGIVHRDVKPQNILLDQKFDLKFIDFGFSTYLNRGLIKNRCGTEAYMAPEVGQKGYEGKSADLFAAGIILFLLYTGTPPFQRANQVDDQYYKALFDKKYNKFWTGHSGRLPQGYLTDDFKDLIEKMFCHNPQQRLSLQQILSHPWMKKDCLMLSEVYQQFVLRKKRIEQFRKMQMQYQLQIRSEMKRHQEKNTQQDKLKGSCKDLEFLEPYLKNIKISNSQIQTSNQINKQDLVINQSSQYFIAILQYTLQNKKNNLIVSSQQNENFTLSIDNQKRQLTVTIITSFKESLQPRSARIKMKLFITNDKRLHIIFDPNSEGDEIITWKFIDFIKNGLYFTT